MEWSIRIARVAGIDVKVHLTFFLLLAWIGWMYYASGGPDAAVHGVAFILALFGCVLLHEFGHAMMARVFGIQTPDITLLPIGGVARLQRMPDKPFQEILVALAGPAVNVVIAGAIFLYLGWRVDLLQTDVISPEPDFLAKLAAINVWLVLFNMLPAFPMDGGRVLRAALAMFMRYSVATQIAARVGQAMAFFFGVWGLFGPHPLLLFIALFVYLAAAQEASYAQMKEIAQGLQVRDAMLTHFLVLDPEARLGEAIDVLLRTGQHEFPVVDSAGRVAGILTRDDMISAYQHDGANTRVGDLMHCEVPTIPADAPLQSALRQMQEHSCPALAATDRDGRVVGLIAPERIGELMMIHSALRRGESPAWHRES